MRKERTNLRYRLLRLHLGLKQVHSLSCAAAIMIVLAFQTSCTKNLQKEISVYQSDFKSNDLSSIANGELFKFNGSTLLGRYNGSGFTLTLNDLPDHDLLRISFDLYLHDTWDGNSTGIGNSDGPDIWQMKVDGASHISTTFSNSDCTDAYCLPQSYPNGYMVQNNPRSNAHRFDLPGVCYWKDKITGTSMYKIVRTIEHSKSSMVLECLDKLKSAPSADRLCDESWSVDNIEVKAIKFR